MPLALACGAPASDEGIGDVPEWTLRRGLAIGSPDDPVYGLWAVGGVLVDQDRVYVLLARDGTIRVFTRDDAFVRDLGGRGSGPGELMLPMTMGWSKPGTLSIGDAELRRFTFYEVATGEVRTIPYHAYAPDAPGTARPVPLVALSESRAAAAPQAPDAAPEHGILTTVPMVVLDTAGALRDTLTLLSAQNSVNITAGLVVGGDGTAWIAGLDEDGERDWLVFDASGASIGRFRLPTRWHIDYANRNEAWVVERDALDIPYVVRYEIMR